MCPELWPTHRVTRWAEFTAIVNELIPEIITYPGPILFRGCPDESAPLIPSLTRYLASETRTAALGIELDALEQFRSRIRELDEQPLLLVSDDYESRYDFLGWWSFMHHYHAPTRLLAWTSSPYIALYHAVETGWGGEG